MFKSGISVAKLIEQVRAEADIAIDISDNVLLQSYNGLIVGLYRDVIRNECSRSYAIQQKSGDKVADWTTVDFSSENVYRVYTEDLFEAEKVNPTFALITDRVCWYPSGDKIITLKNFPGENCIIVYFEVPGIVSGTSGTVDVPMPADFIDLVKAKIRGDMYSISNDDDLAAKWYGIYNSRIEDFKIWVSENKAEVRG